MWSDLSRIVNILLALLILREQMGDFIVLFTEARVNKIFATLLFHGMQMSEPKNTCDFSHASARASPVSYKKPPNELPSSNLGACMGIPRAGSIYVRLAVQALGPIRAWLSLRPSSSESKGRVCWVRICSLRQGRCDAGLLKGPPSSQPFQLQTILLF